MTDKKISELGTITQGDIASGDWIAVVDSSENATKKFDFSVVVAAYNPFDDVTSFFDSTDTFTAGTIVRTRAEGFAYRAVDTGGDVFNEGVQNFEVLPGNAGYNILAFGADNTGNTDVSPLVQKAHDALSSSTGGRIHFPSGNYLWNTEVNITKSSVILSGEGGWDGSAITLGANIVGSMMTFGEATTGNNIFGCAVRDLFFFGSDRTFTCDAVINADGSDLMRIFNVECRQMDGSLIRMNRCVRPIVNNVSTQLVGGTGKPVIFITDGNISGFQVVTQGGCFDNMHIEENASVGLYLGTNAFACKFSNMTFETSSAGGEAHMEIAGNGNLFSNVSVSRQPTLTDAAKVICSGDENRFENFHFSGDGNGNLEFQDTGFRNSLSGVTARGRNGGADATRKWMQSTGTYFSLSDVSCHFFGTCELLGVYSVVKGFYASGGGDIDLLVGERWGVVDGFVSVINAASNGPVIKSTDYETYLSNIDVQSPATTDDAILIEGYRTKINNWTVRDASGTALANTSFDGAILNGYVDGVAKHGIRVTDAIKQISNNTIMDAGKTAGTWNGIDMNATANVFGGVISGNYIDEKTGTLANGIFANDNAGTEYYRRYAITGNSIEVSATPITFPNTLGLSVVANNVTA